MLTKIPFIHDWLIFHDDSLSLKELNRSRGNGVLG